MCFAHKSNRDLFRFAYCYRFTLPLLCTMIFSNFFVLLQQDEIVSKCNDHSQDIHSSIINNLDASALIPFGKFGAFPLLTCAGEDQFDIVYHLSPGVISILTNKSSNFKAIIGMNDRGSPTEVKDMSNLQLSKGKTAKCD